MKKKYIIITILVFTTSIAFLAFTSIENKSKTAFIEIGDVFNNFEMKKEMEKRFDETKNTRQRILDSLAVNLKILSNKIDSKKADQHEIEKYEAQRQLYFQRMKQFEEDNQHLSEDYDNKIINQMNQYIKDYGNKYGYEYIFGNDKNGSLMFAMESRNISTEVIKYINERYNGVK
jgi:outer membrane protein